MKRHFERRHHSAHVQLTRRIVCAFATIVVALATIIGASGCSSSQNASSTYTLVENGKLTVASDLATPPFEYVNDSGEDQGFTYELMGMIADELGLELNYLPAQKFDGIIPMVKQGVKTDVGACNITITDERKKEVDFTDPYIDSNQGVAVAKNIGYDTVDSLNAPGVKIAVQSGTTSEEWAIENLPQATTVNFDDWTTAFTAVMSGQCQAVVCDLPVEQWMVSNSFTGMEIIKEVPTGEQFGIAVSKDNPELTQAINDALAKIKSSGAYDKLYEKWFGMAPTSGSDYEDASSPEDATGASLAVTSATAKSNEDGGNGVLGGIATRLTWEATTGSDEGEVSQIELELPEGGSFESTDVKVTLLDGLNQTGVKASCSLDGSKLVIKFADPVAAGSQIRVVVPDVVFPSNAGAYAVTGSYVTDGDKRDLPESNTISVSESTMVQEIVAWLDAQPWVAAWNSNPFLGMFCKPQIIVTSIASLFRGWGIALAVTAIGWRARHQLFGLSCRDFPCRHRERTAWSSGSCLLAWHDLVPSYVAHRDPAGCTLRYTDYDQRVRYAVQGHVAAFERWHHGAHAVLQKPHGHHGQHYALHLRRTLLSGRDDSAHPHRHQGGASSRRAQQALTAHT